MAQTFRVLIVDDEAPVRKALSRTFRREGYEVLLAEGPEQALETLESSEIDLILADHKMPGMTGVDLLREVRRRWPWIVRIMLTGHADLQTTLDAVNDAEVQRFLTKPWDNEELRATVREVLEQLRLLHEAPGMPEIGREQEAALRERHRLEKLYPGITSLDWDDDGNLLLNVS